MYNVLDKLRSGEPLSVKERTLHEHGLVSVLRQLHDELDAAVLDAYDWSDLRPLLRIAHGNEVSLLQLAGEGARRSDEGARNSSGPPASRHIDSPAPSPQPSPASGRGGDSVTHDDAKRAFDEAILERLVALNVERAAEEARGLVRWLRPEFQNPQAHAAPVQSSFDTDPGEPALQPVVAAKPLPWPKDTVDQVLRALSDLLSASAVSLSLDDIAARFTGRGRLVAGIPFGRTQCAAWAKTGVPLLRPSGTFSPQAGRRTTLLRPAKQGEGCVASRIRERRWVSLRSTHPAE